MTILCDVQHAKRKLRQILEGRLSSADLLNKSKSELIARRVIALPEFDDASWVGLYAAKPREVDTRVIFETAIALGKQIAFPAVEGANLHFRHVDRLSRLSLGFAGISEPQFGPEISPSRFDLLLVPGRGFDLSRNRLGRGHGFFDRWLKNSADRPRTLVGLSFESQLVQRIPVSAHDVRMDMIVTEERVIR